MARLFKQKFKEIVYVPVRYRNGPDHWSMLKKKNKAKDKALEHFDDFYASVYGAQWEEIRTALLHENNKYVAVTNNFSDVENIRSKLETAGALNLKSIYNTFAEHIRKCDKMQIKTKYSISHGGSQEISPIASDNPLSDAPSVYPADYPLSKSLQPEDDEILDEPQGLKPVPLKSIDTDLNDISIDEHRIVYPSSSTTSALYEFVPATKLKGADDWVYESDYYKHYSKGSTFSINVEKESNLRIPEYLNIYTFEENNYSRFPAPKRGSTGVLDYYLFDGGSILPVLALDLQAGDVVLDMCAAPGGKALAILQTLLPKLVVVNDISQSRIKRLQSVINQYISDMAQWNDKLFVTKGDARQIADKDMYNKILVDVPCTTDRHMLHTDENNLFKGSRVKERLQIPELQTEILTNALKLVAVGGTVVYSTCTLSPIQNDGVVQMALKNTWEESDSIMVVKDMTEALQPLKYLYQFGNAGLKYGHIVVPTPKKNLGPLYFCKIVRVR